MVNNISEISSELLFDEIDYRIVNNKLADLKYESIDFLKKALAYDI